MHDKSCDIREVNIENSGFVFLFSTDFRGRLSLAGYWSFLIFHFIFTFLFSFLTFGFFLGDVSFVYSLIVLVPHLAAFVRRLHDTGASGLGAVLALVMSLLIFPACLGSPIILGVYIILIPLFLILLLSIVRALCRPGDVGENKYGPNPNDTKSNDIKDLAIPEVEEKDQITPCNDPLKVQLWEGGPYWATKNIGAENPEDSGYYFWWGDTVGYKRENNKWVASDGLNSNFSFLSANAPTYGKLISTLKNEGWITSDGVLAPEHDAAHVHWGDGWLMPTRDELNALRKECDWTWITLNGVKGYVVKGRGAYASKSIFLPAAGYGNGTSLDYFGSFGYDWSSVSDSDCGGHCACGLGFDTSRHSMYSRSRNVGQPVRPIQGFTK